MKGSIVAALAVVAVTSSAFAQDYPAKPIRMIVPNSAGGATDFAARVVGPRLTEVLGQPIVIENRVAAGGVVGTNQVAQSAPDGYTLIMVLDSFPTNPHLFKGVQYDALKDFAPIMLIARTPQVVVANPAVGPKSFREFVQLARAQGQKMNHGTAGAGTSSRLGYEMLKEAAGIDTTAIHYKGGAPAINDLLGGQFPVMMVSLTPIYPHLKAGKVTGLAVTSPKRWPGLSDIPAVAETFPGFEIMSWVGLLAPAKTPKPILDKLHESLRKTLAFPDVREKFESQGNEVVGSSPADFAELIRMEYARWGKIIRDRGITVE